VASFLPIRASIVTMASAIRTQPFGIFASKKWTTPRGFPHGIGAAERKNYTHTRSISTSTTPFDWSKFGGIHSGWKMAELTTPKITRD
jgi:hypothetical protein